jgi:pimeloyl-ACP methyl ester carboxylesterase
VQTADGQRIDALYVRPDQAATNRAVHGVAHGTCNGSQRPTVVFCNPNAGYYEYAFCFQEPWIDFYRSRGFNLLLWNYRGYVRSDGFPTPRNLLLDGEQVIKWVRENRAADKIVLHGESLGGVVAAYLARKCGCDFLFADRTFGDLNSVAQASAGSIFARLLRWITRWVFDSTANYLEASCYKLIGNDPSDTMIPEVASLKSGVTRAVVSVRVDGATLCSFQP